MLRRHCEEMDERAARWGTAVGDDALVFSLEPDCACPMPPGFLSRRVAVRKEMLGIANKRPETIAMEDEALHLYRRTPERRLVGRTGPSPKSVMTYRAIGSRLGANVVQRWPSLLPNVARLPWRGDCGFVSMGPCRGCGASRPPNTQADSL